MHIKFTLEYNIAVSELKVSNAIIAIIHEAFLNFKCNYIFSVDNNHYKCREKSKDYLINNTKHENNIYIDIISRV